MKNFKHAVKNSNKAVKLAAVASAAIMMAPVALTSVSSFAATTAATPTTVVTTPAEAAAAALATAKEVYATLTATEKANANGVALNKAITDYETNGGDYTASAATLNAAATTAKAGSSAAFKAALDTATALYATLTDAQKTTANGKILGDNVTNGTKAYSATTTDEQDAAWTKALNDTVAVVKVDAAKAANDAAIQTAHAFDIAPTTTHAQSAAIAAAYTADLAAVKAAGSDAAKIDAATTAFNTAVAAAKAGKVSLKRSGTAKVTYVKGYGIQVYTAAGTLVKNADGTAKKLMNGTSWKTFGEATTITVKGQKQNVINVGGDQYVQVAYLTVTAL